MKMMFGLTGAALTAEESATTSGDMYCNAKMALKRSWNFITPVCSL
jgi:hypothetical protein